MKTLATLLSLAVLVTVSTCMSLQEYEDDEMTSRNPSWGVHVHFHFHSMVEEEPKPVCTKDRCELCADNKYEISISREITAKSAFKGCLVMTKEPNNMYSFELKLGSKKVYKNTYEGFNRFSVLPCLNAKNTGNEYEADMCPVLFDVDVKEAKLCARIDQTIRLTHTVVRHEVQLGCVDM